MPDRLIRESALTSESLAQLGDFAERLFWRLTTVADDYGRFNANPAVIRGRCMPLIAGATEKRIESAICELVNGGAVTLYEVEGRKLGYFTKWDKHQRTRQGKPKFPDPPPLAATCGELQQSAALFVNENVFVNENDQQSRKTVPPSQKSDSADWPAQDLWLRNFLQEQQTAFNGVHVPHLLDAAWWNDVSISTNGIDLNFLAPQFARMAAWLKENPRNMPTPKGVRRFVRRWLERAAEKERVKR